MYGSLINHISGTPQDMIPEVGMGATVLLWTDREPATVVSVSKSGKSLIVKGDHAERVDDNGMSEQQEYKFSPNPDAIGVEFTLRKNGQWVRKGEPMKGGQRIILGKRSKYYDFSF
jgi:hypothetical protein